MNSEVDQYLKNAPAWRSEMQALRKILLESGLTETFKWRSPCYMVGDSNVVIIGAFKNYCTLSFFKGSLMPDPLELLVSPGEHSQAVRMIKLTSVEQIEDLKPHLPDYIRAAVQIEKEGLKVEFRKGPEIQVPEELLTAFHGMPDLKEAFDTLTPGRQRAYLLLFSAPKQSATRSARIEKYTDRILDGKGPDDCVCGLSKSMPRCDGSHKTQKNR